MKNLRNIVRWVVGTLLSIYLLLLIAVNFTPCRRFLTKTVEQELAEKLGSEVHIGDVEIGLLNRVTLHNVTIKDRAREPLVSAGMLSVKVDWASILKGDITLRTATLLDGDIRLYKEKADSAANFQFLIDAFQSPDKKGPSRLNLCINSVVVRRCQARYDARYKPATPGRLNPAHLHISELDASISLKRLTQDALHLRIRSLSFREQSGLRITALRLRMMADRHSCDLQDFRLTMPASEITLPHLHATYDGSSAQQFWKTLKMTGSLTEARIATDDLSPALPELGCLHQRLILSADYQISPKSIHLAQLRLHNHTGTINLYGKLMMERQDGQPKTIRAELSQCHVEHTTLTQMMTALAESLPKATWAASPIWKNMGDMDFTGKMQAVVDKSGNADGELITGAGKAKGHIAWQQDTWDGWMQLENLRPDQLLGRTDLPTDIEMLVKGKGKRGSNATPSVSAEAEIRKCTWNGRTFAPATLQADWQAHRIDVQLNSTDDAANLTAIARAAFDGKTLSDLSLEADIKSLHPAILGLKHQMADAHYALHLSGKADKIKFPDLTANVEIDDFRMTAGDTCHVPFIYASIRPSTRGSRLVLDASFAHAELDGPLSANAWQQLIQQLKDDLLPHAASAPLPASKNTASTKQAERQSRKAPEWEVKLRVNDTEFLNKVLRIPLYLDDAVFLEGRIGGQDKEALLSLHTRAALRYGSFQLQKPSLYLRGKDGTYSLLARAGRHIGKNDMTFELQAASAGDSLTMDLGWQDSGKGHFRGELKTTSDLEATDVWTTRVHPSSLIINDTLWHFSPGQMRLPRDGRVEVQNVGITRPGQSLLINGVLSRHPSDALTAHLESIDVDYILGLFKIKPVSFAGRATGDITLAGALDSINVDARNLDIPDFHFNGALLGHATINGGFNVRNKRIMLDADIREEGEGYTLVKGYVSPAEKALDLQVNNLRTNIGFLDRYVGGIFGPITGRVSGNCRIHGSFAALNFDGEEQGGMQTTIRATGVPYTLSDGTVTMRDGAFIFNDFIIADALGGTGRLQGTLKHTHLKNINYDFRVQANKLLLYDREQEPDMPFYATAVGTGQVQLSGYPGNFQADINMRPDARTRLYYIVDSPETFSDGSLLRYTSADIPEDDTDSMMVANGNRQPAGSKSSTGQVVSNTSTTNIRLDFTIDMNPEARLYVIMDGKTGDKIELGGTGTLTAKYYNKGDFTLNGRFTVADGNYKMSIQDLIRKEFVFTPGGSINFTGSPFSSDLNLRAVYTVPSVSLSDLNIGTGLSESSIPVNCVLNFGGTAGQPEITFDLEMPRVSDDISRMVRSLISSEEDMNMQVLYLLGVGRFYTYDFGSTEAAANQSQSSVAMKSFLSNTLSSQLNNIISNAMGTSNWTFGANLSTGSIGWSDMEVEGLLSGRLLNNRLIFNGNFGYHDRSAYSGTNFVGDFDLNYLITPGGGVSVKVYSETNDRYFSKSSLTTQGAGIRLKRDFTNLKDLFSVRRKTAGKKKSQKP